MAHDGSTNRLGAPLALALDPDTEGWWKVAFDLDYSEEAVRKATEALHKDSPLKRANPRVYLDPDYPGRHKGA